MFPSAGAGQEAPELEASLGYPRSPNIQVKDFSRLVLKTDVHKRHLLPPQLWSLWLPGFSLVCLSLRPKAGGPLSTMGTWLWGLPCRLSQYRPSPSRQGETRGNTPAIPWGAQLFLQDKLQRLAIISTLFRYGPHLPVPGLRRGQWERWGTMPVAATWRAGQIPLYAAH